MRSVVLGIDCSPLRLGWGLVCLETGEAIACGMERIDLPHKGWSHQQVARALREVEFFAPGGTNVAFIAVEEPGLPPVSGTKSAYNAGRAVQEAVNACQRRWPHAPIVELKPSEWKSLAGLPGNAKKAALREAAFTFASDCGATWTESQDAADALLIALAGQRRNQETWDRAVERGVA